MESAWPVVFAASTFSIVLQLDCIDDVLNSLTDVVVSGIHVSDKAVYQELAKMFHRQNIQEPHVPYIHK